MDNNPFLAKTHRFSKEEATRHGDDPHANDLGLEYQTLNAGIYPHGLLPHQIGAKEQHVPLQKARMRNKRGEYQSIDVGGDPLGTDRGSGRGTNRSNRPSHRAGSLTAGSVGQRSRVVNVKKAEDRLRMIEQISKYREEKIKREFLKLEEDLRAEDEK